MKKVCMFLFIGVFLTMMVSLPGVAQEEQKAKVKFSLNLGGLFASTSQGYDFSSNFEARSEVANWTEAVANLGGKFGFDVGASVFPIPVLEIYSSYSTYGGNALGDYTFSLPHPLYWDEITISSIAEFENEFKATVVNIGVAFHPALSGKIKPYFAVGASSVTVKMDLLSSISFVNTYEEYWYWDGWYPYEWELTSRDDVITITRVGYTNESATVWGFHAKAGVNIALAKNISIFLEGRFLSATVIFDHPGVMIEGDVDYYERGDSWDGYWYTLTGTWTEEWELAIADEMEIKVGGIQGIVGVKFSF